MLNLGDVLAFFLSARRVTDSHNSFTSAKESQLAWLCLYFVVQLSHGHVQPCIFACNRSAIIYSRDRARNLLNLCGRKLECL
jgi:hypothetical protein